LGIKIWDLEAENRKLKSENRRLRITISALKGSKKSK
jgi:hypothetical protein